MDVKNVIIIALVFLFYLPVFSGLVDSWSIDPYYSHGFIVPLISAYFAWTKRKDLLASDKDFLYGAVSLAAGLAVYGIGILYKSLFVSAFSFIIVLAGLILAFYGRKVLKELSFPIAFLIFMVPLPYADYASTDLETVTASLSAYVVGALGIPVEHNGSQIKLSDSLFVIGETCSGLRTMLALFALAAVYAYVVNGSYPKKALLFLSALPVALAANVFRVVLILLIANYFGTEFAMHFFHDASSILLFLLAFVFLIIVGRCLGCKGLRNI